MAGTASRSVAVRRRRAREGGRQPDPRVEQTRRDVLRAALELIAEQGFEGATIERIARRSGVARSTIYRHWPEPSKLYVEAFEPLAERPPERPTGRFDLDLRRYLDEYAARLNDPVYFAAYLALTERAVRAPAWAPAHRAVEDRDSARAEDLLRAGIKAGTVRPGIDVERAAAEVLSPFLYARLVRLERITPAERARVRRELVARFGVSADSTNPPFATLRRTARRP